MIEAEDQKLHQQRGQLALFRQRAEEAAARVEVCATETELIKAVSSSISLFDADLPPMAAFSNNLPDAVVQELLRVTGAEIHLSEKNISQYTVGLTDALLGVASSGSVCIPVDSGMVAPVSVFARHQFVILEETRLVHRPKEAIERIAGDFVFVTGPSATADMGALVRGVHGPHTLSIFVLRDRL